MNKPQISFDYVHINALLLDHRQHQSYKTFSLVFLQASPSSASGGINRISFQRYEAH